MKYAILADVHLASHAVFGGPTLAGVNTRASLIARVLDTAVQLVPGCHVVVAGDLFDTVRPSPQLIRLAQAALSRTHQATVLVGNHDQVSAAPGDHALGPLAPVASVVDVPTVQGPLVLVPFHRPTTVQPTATYIPAVLDQLALDHGPHTGRLLVLHTGLSGPDTPAFLQSSLGAVPVDQLAQVCAGHGIQAVVSGDWHRQARFRVAGVQLVQVGALAPTGFDDPGPVGYGGLVTWDPDTQALETYQLPGPRFLAVTSVAEAVRVIQRHPDPGYTWAVQVTVPPAQVASVQAELAEVPGLLGRRVVADRVQVAAATEAAAQAVRSATPGDQVAAWVFAHGVPGGLDPARVVQLACEYLDG